MITGYNHNIIHNERVFHIQTEDSGTKYPHIITHLFVGGNILSSKKKSYDHLMEQGLTEEGLEKAVRAMMQEQHKDMLRELKAGKHDGHPLLADSDHKRVAPGPLPGASSVIAPELNATDPSEAVDSPVSRIVMPTESAPPAARPAPPIEPPRAPLFHKAVVDEEKPAESATPAPPSIEPRSGMMLRGSARMSRRRPSRERPSFQIPMSPTQPKPPSKPTAVMSALRNIEIGSGDNLDSVLFEEESPTIPELPSASPEFSPARMSGHQAPHGPLQPPVPLDPEPPASYHGGHSNPSQATGSETQEQEARPWLGREPRVESSDATMVMTPILQAWIQSGGNDENASEPAEPSSSQPLVKVSVTPASKDS
ncbi:MAG: hypothetical protein EP343_16625 [Deltaproteobacteria bacterium]|nr:MAG: hypothetical protein EP343_16625 [Deltaproteobacteria bacterium]